MTYEPSPELNDLVSAAAEGGLSDDAARQLNKLLRNDPAARSFYVDYLEVHALLHWRHGSVEPLELPLAAPAAKRREVRPANYRWLAVGGLAIVVAVGFILLVATGRAPWQQPSATAPIAIVLDQNDVRWAGESVTGSGGQLRPGRQRIESGVAHIELTGGVLLAAAGPVDFEITAVDRIHLHHGKLHIYSPLATRGFTVTTPRGVQIVDLGTRFGVWADDNDAVRVHLFDGKLQINGQTDLTTGQAIEVDANGELRDVECNASIFPPLHHE